MTRAPHIYISHSWSTGDSYDKLQRILRSAPECNGRLLCLPKDDPIHATGADYELRGEMRKLMTQAQILIVQVGAYDKLKRWVDEEIDLARGGFTHRRPVLAIVPFGHEALAAALEQRVDVLVPWSASEIVAATARLLSEPLQPVAAHEHAARGVRTPMRTTEPPKLTKAAVAKPASQTSNADLRRALFGQRLSSTSS